MVQRARMITAPLAMLVAVPMIMAASGTDDDGGVKRMSEVALKAIDVNGGDWDDVLKGYGLIQLNSYRALLEIAYH